MIDDWNLLEEMIGDLDDLETLVRPQDAHIVQKIAQKYKDKLEVVFSDLENMVRQMEEEMTKRNMQVNMNHMNEGKDTMLARVKRIRKRMNL